MFDQKCSYIRINIVIFFFIPLRLTSIAIFLYNRFRLTSSDFQVLESGVKEKKAAFIDSEK